MKLSTIFKQCLVLGALAFSSYVMASVDSDLNNFFNKLGGGSNASRSELVKGQSAGYLVGGSFYARVPVRNIQLISLTLPEVNAGCGGIDAYLGSFSFINNDQLKAMGKAILSNAVGYAFDLALETTCPQCKSVKDFLQDLSNQVNSLNVSTCQAAQGIVGGLIPKSLARDYDLCQKLGTQNNVFSDWAQARQGCGKRTDEVLNKAKPDQKDQVPRNKNLVWSSFTKINAVVSSDRQLKELMMTIVGTVIYDNKGNMTVLPSLGANDNLLNALLYGGKTTAYVCDETTNCLKPKKSEINISQNASLVSKVDAILTSIYDDAKTDSAIKEPQARLAENTRIPIISYVRDVAMLDASKYFVNNLSEYIALDFAIRYVEGLIDLVGVAGANSFTTDEENKAFKDNLSTVREKLSQNLSKVQIQQDAYITSIQQFEVLRKQLSNKIVGQMNFE